MNAPLTLEALPSLTTLNGFRPKIDFTINFGDFETRTAQNAAEVEQALRLRHQIFIEEHGLNPLHQSIDMDEFDSIADHLLLIDKLQKKVVGTYRMLSSLWTQNFYSETEFDLQPIKALPGIKLELGRACVHPDYRNSSAIQMLWKGMTHYFSACEARYMFGCSSLDARPGTDFTLIHTWLITHHLSPSSARVVPCNHYLPSHVKLQTTSSIELPQWERRAERLTPALLKAYLRAGAQICGQPAYDSEFNTLDYFTLFDRTRMNQNYGKKFGVEIH